MTSSRPYRLPIDREQAFEELRRCSGTQFDPDVVATFCTIAQLERRRASAA